MPLPFDIADLELTPLSDSCPREAFSCGDDVVDQWFHTHACKRHDGYECRVNLLVAPGDPTPAGFMAMGMKALPQQLLTKDLRSHLFVAAPGHIPVIELKWIAVRTDLQENKLGRYIMGLVLDEFRHAIEHYAAEALALEAIDQKTQDFYYKLGFRRYGPPILRRQMLLGSRAMLAAEAASKAI